MSRIVTPEMLGLPDDVRACLFDLDGVITQTARVHATAWKRMFDDYLAARPEPQAPFDPDADYHRYVDGKPRYDGVRDFLASRGIRLPEGDSDDPPSRETVRGLGNRKNELVLELIERDGVDVYDGSVRYLRAVRDAGLRRALVSSSRNARTILRAAGLEDAFEVIVDGLVAAERGLAGKPAPDTFLEAARELGVPPERAVVFEDAIAGVEAGRAGGFRCVVGVDRAGQAHRLRTAGADIVVGDLALLMQEDR